MWVVIAVTTCFYNKLRRNSMKIIKRKSMMFLLVFLFIFTTALTLQKKVRSYTFTNKNTNEVQKTSEKDISEKESAYL